MNAQTFADGKWAMEWVEVGGEMGGDKGLVASLMLSYSFFRATLSSTFIESWATSVDPSRR